MLEVTGGHPYATQELAYFLWQETAEGEQADDARLELPRLVAAVAAGAAVDARAPVLGALSGREFRAALGAGAAIRAGTAVGLGPGASFESKTGSAATVAGRSCS